MFSSDSSLGLLGSLYSAIARDLIPETPSRSDPLVYENPVAFLTQHLFIPELQAPITLHPEQERVIDAMMRRDGKQFRYSTMVYSSVKKSAKTTIGGGLALWQGWRIPNGYIYIVGNDLNQADNRMMQAIRYAVLHNPDMQFRARIVRNTIYLDNGTTIEAVPVDAAGEAGGNPTGIFWTEVWGAKQKRHEEMWSEMALSPTRQGESFKFVESYAGHSGESLILERLYDALVKPENVLDPKISPELYAHGRSIAYWNTRRYLSWQINNPDYYAQEALEKTPSEFARQHENKWVSSEGVFVPPGWWDDCEDADACAAVSGPVVVALDAAISGDSFAVVTVTRSKGIVYVKECRVWYPPPAGKIDYADIERYVRDLKQRYIVREFAYDQYQMHSMATRLYGRLGFWRAFPQSQDRLVADKQLYDFIRDGKIVHDGDRELAAHIANANAKMEGDKLRIVKRNEQKKVDAAVCLSMAVARAEHYRIGGEA